MRTVRWPTLIAAKATPFRFPINPDACASIASFERMTVFAGNGVAGRHKNMASALFTLKAMFWVNW
jgi:hypothetical protein